MPIATFALLVLIMAIGPSEAFIKCLLGFIGILIILAVIEFINMNKKGGGR